VKKDPHKETGGHVKRKCNLVTTNGETDRKDKGKKEIKRISSRKKKERLSE
jgi:hypothetical protein